jgi:predicted DNA-binding transcriptional regulator AlpA
MYTLREVAERWQKSENDILRMAIEGEVVLSAWWSGIFLLETSRDRWVEPCNGLFEIKREIIGELLTCGESLEISSFENGAESIYFALEEPNRLVSFELTREKIVIDFAHLADAEAKHPELVSHSHSIVQPTVREPERPLRGMKAIAEYCGVHQDTIKNWRKQCKDFPAASSGRGAVTALPSEINAWMTKNKKTT